MERLCGLDKPSLQKSKHERDIDQYKTSEIKCTQSLETINQHAILDSDSYRRMTSERQI